MSLKPLLVILGGVREIGATEYSKRHGSKQIKSHGNKIIVDMHVRQQKKIKDMYTWRATRRFIVNSQNALKSVAYKTPIGLICLKSEKPSLHALREQMLLEVVELNKENRNIQVIVELTWTDLTDDAISMLQTTVPSSKLPKKFFL